MLTQETERRSSRRFVPVLSVLAGLLPVAGLLQAQSLDGSRESLIRQNLGAQEQGFSYLHTVGDVQEFTHLGLLVPVQGNGDFELADDVSFNVARPEVKSFVEWLAKHYRANCGEPLVVTSLTRPTSHQPRNASEISVHPTGIALDLRRSDRSSCRRWLEANLMDLEGKGVIEATREHSPAHYHVAVFGPAFDRMVENPADLPAFVTASNPVSPASHGRRGSIHIQFHNRHDRAHHGVAVAASQAEPARGKSARQTRRSAKAARAKAQGLKVKVGPGDNLWQIARRHGTSVSVIKRANHIQSDGDLRAGQVLSIPSH